MFSYLFFCSLTATRSIGCRAYNGGIIINSYRHSAAAESGSYWNWPGAEHSSIWDPAHPKLHLLRAASGWLQIREAFGKYGIFCELTHVEIIFTGCWTIVKICLSRLHLADIFSRFLETVHSVTALQIVYQVTVTLANAAVKPITSYPLSVNILVESIVTVIVQVPSLVIYSLLWTDTSCSATLYHESIDYLDGCSFPCFAVFYR